MTPEQIVTLVVFGAVPIVLAVMGGVGWLIKYAITSGKSTPADRPQITQGQTIGTGLSEYLEAELKRERAESGEAEARERVYRDRLIRAGVDPDALLRDAGLL